MHPYIQGLQNPFRGHAMLKMLATTLKLDYSNVIEHMREIRTKQVGRNIYVFHNSCVDVDEGVFEKI